MNISSEELHSRKPTPEEMKYYNLEENYAVFLPSLDVAEVDDELVAETVQVEFMPVMLKKHVKNQSMFIKSLLE